MKYDTCIYCKNKTDGSPICSECDSRYWDDRDEEHEPEEPTDE